MPSSSLPSSRSSAEGIEYALAGITDANFISLSVLMALTAVFLGNVIVKKKRQKAHNIPFVLYTGSAETDAELFQAKASEMVNKGRKEHPDSPFFINNDMGPYLILPSRLAHVIRNTNAFNFAMFLKDYYHNGAPGFEPFIGASRKDKLFQAVSRKRLTNSLSKKLTRCYRLCWLPSNFSGRKAVWQAVVTNLHSRQDHRAPLPRGELCLGFAVWDLDRLV